MKIAFLFDFDGVIVESESLHLETFREIVGPLGIKISDKRWYMEFVGVGSPHIMKTLLGEIGITDEKIIKKYVDERRNLFQKRILENRLQPKKGIEKFMEKIKKRGIKTAIVSGGHKENIKVALSILKLDKYFDIVIGREDYDKRKPDPECYLVAAKKLKVEPSKCIAFEDSLSGCLAAKAAKMKIVAIKAPFDVEKGGCKPDIKIKDFENKNVEFFEKVIK